MKSEKYGKLALGHHMDDAVETLYMNMLFNGQISSMPPKVSMFKGDFEIIRPLILLRDKEILRYSRIKKFPDQKIPCPHSKFSKRNDIRQIIDQMEKLYPNGVRNIFRSMGDIKPDYLPKINLD
jgi:tRNA(Ile)-lysidine synthase TilS/MesJ